VFDLYRFEEAADFSGKVSTALRHAGLARIGLGYQQSYPQLLGITLQTLKNQALRPMSSGQFALESFR
jgi:hypothetical protein